jgi:hypothetical protein
MLRKSDEPESETNKYAGFGGSFANSVCTTEAGKSASMQSTEATSAQAASVESDRRAQIRFDSGPSTDRPRSTRHRLTFSSWLVADYRSMRRSSASARRRRSIVALESSRVLLPL